MMKRKKNRIDMQINQEIINNKREVITAADIKRYMIYLALALILLSLSIWTFSVTERPTLPNLIGLALFWGSVSFLLFFISNIKTITARVTVTENRIEYSDIMTKIDCTWENIRQIDVISQKYISEKYEVISTWTDYKIYTWEQNFSLNCRDCVYLFGVNFWNDRTLKSIYEKIISKNPKIQIIKKDNIIQYRPLDYHDQV